MAPVLKPKVSICLPIFNGSAFLCEAISSVLSQSFTDFELLVADDGSQDDSVAIAKKFADADQRIVFWQNSKRLGLFANYNACLAKASGNYIKLFAQDDLLEPNTLARMVDVLEREPGVTLVSGGRAWIDQEGQETKRIVQFSEDRLITGKDVVIAHLIVLGNWVGEPSTVMFRARDIGAGFNHDYYHYGDIEYWFRLLRNGQLYYISDVVCQFRRHAASTTTRNLTGLYFALDILRLGRQYEDVLGELGESLEHFFKRAVETIALHVDHLVRKEGLTLEKVIAAGVENGQIPISSTNREQLMANSDSEITRQALFHFSIRVTELLQELIETKNELEHRQAECKRLWQAVNQMTNSVSWRLTAPLRNVREKMNQPSAGDTSGL